MTGFFPCPPSPPWRRPDSWFRTYRPYELLFCTPYSQSYILIRSDAATLASAGCMYSVRGARPHTVSEGSGPHTFAVAVPHTYLYVCIPYSKATVYHSIGTTASNAYRGACAGIPAPYIGGAAVVGTASDPAQMKGKAIEPATVSFCLSRAASRNLGGGRSEGEKRAREVGDVYVASCCLP